MSYACPRCGGRLRVIALMQDPAVVRTIVTHVHRALSTEAPGSATRPCRARVDSPLDTRPSQGPSHARSATGALDATPFYYKVLGPTSPAPPATAEHTNRSD